MSEQRSQGGGCITRGQVIAIFVILGVMVAVLYPPFARAREHARYCSCECNMKELATAMHMYWTDYDGMLPSSVLHDPLKSKQWNPRISAEFCSERGTLPPPEDLTAHDTHWVQLLYPHMKNKDTIWCPSDTDITIGDGAKDRQAMVSYIYKPALDRAWFGSMCPVDPLKPNEKLQMKCFRKEEVFEYVADQIFLFEKKGWHWGDKGKRWSNGVRLNAAFLDGHVRHIKLKNAINKPAPNDSAELAKYLLMDGEPMYYNYYITDPAGYIDPSKGKFVKGQCYDPRIYYDNLP